jgi:hypothetical protein
MAEILNNEILKDKIGYYHFRGHLISHIGKRMDELKGKAETEYDYCTQVGALKELQILLEAIKEYSTPSNQEETKKED